MYGTPSWESAHQVHVNVVAPAYRDIELEAVHVCSSYKRHSSTLVYSPDTP